MIVWKGDTIIMAVVVKRKTNNLEKLTRKLELLKKSSVSTGYFKEQGNHPDTELSYAQMMNLHEYGFFGSYARVPSRPVRAILTVNLKMSLPKYLTRQLSKYLYANLHLSELLDDIGKYSTSEAQSIFGSSALSPNSPVTVEIKGFDSPLIDTGFLRGNWSWKTSSKNSFQNLSFT